MLHIFADGGGTGRLYSPAGLLALAAARCGRTAPANDSDAGALDHLCDAFEDAQSGQTTFGRLQAQAILLDALAKRLRLSDYLQRLPEIRSVALPNPIFIVAPFRTGTTFLQRLLSQDRESRWPRVWEVAYPPPAEPDLRGDARYFSEDPRIARAAASLRLLHRAGPALSRLHPMGPDLAEECFGLLETSLTSHSFMFYAELPAYLEWLDSRDATEWRSVYELYANQLRLLHWWHPGRHWVLKSPVHLWNLDSLLQVFPDAYVIQMHRDPTVVMGSFCRLLTAHREVAWKGSSPAAIGAQAMTYMRNALARAVTARRRLDASRFIDISFEELTGRPIQSVHAIYTRIGAQLAPQAAAGMTLWLSQAGRLSPNEKTGIESFGIDQDEVQEIFSAYSALLETNG